MTKVLPLPLSRKSTVLATARGREMCASGLRKGGLMADVAGRVGMEIFMVNVCLVARRLQRGDESNDDSYTERERTREIVNFN
jgi:hypothetical protein